MWTEEYKTTYAISVASRNSWVLTKTSASSFRKEIKMMQNIKHTLGLECELWPLTISCDISTRNVFTHPSPFIFIQKTALNHTQIKLFWVKQQMPKNYHIIWNPINEVTNLHSPISDSSGRKRMLLCQILQVTVIFFCTKWKTLWETIAPSQ